MTFSRRRVLSLGGAALASGIASGLTGAIAAPAVVGVKRLDTRALSFDGYYTREHLKKVTYWVEGSYEPDALTAINRMLRDWRTGDIHPIEPKLLDVLHELGRRLDTDCHFELVSGYRSPKTNAMLHEIDPGVAVHSLHMKGQAIDISLPGRPLEKVYETVLAMKAGGVGYYPDSDFVHVDVGRVRRWLG